MTQMITLTERFKAFQLDDRTDRGNRFDAHPGEWVVTDDQANYVGVLPTIEAARTWAEAQLTRVEQVAVELLGQAEDWEPEMTYTEVAEMWRSLPEEVRAEYTERAQQLVNAYRWVPMTTEWATEVHA